VAGQEDRLEGSAIGNFYEIRAGLGVNEPWAAPDNAAVGLERVPVGEEIKALRRGQKSGDAELWKAREVPGVVFVVMSGDDLIRWLLEHEVADEGPLVRWTGVDQGCSESPQDAGRVDAPAVAADSQALDALPLDVLNDAQGSTPAREVFSSPGRRRG